MKKVLIVVAALVVLVVVLLAIVPHFLDLNSYRGQIQSKLQDALGRPVDFKDLSASLLPPSVKVSNVSIGEDPRFGPGPFATVQQIDVSVKLFPLLRKDVQIESLTLDRPQIQVVRNKQGEWNYASLGKSQTPSQPAETQAKSQQPPVQQQPAESAAPKSQSQFSLAHLTINDGKVGYLDQQANTHAVYDNIDAKLNDFAPGKTFDLDAAVRVGGKSDQRIEVNGNAGPIPEGNNAALMPFDGTITLTNVPIAEMQMVAQSAALQGVNGVASGKLTAKNEKGVMAANGTLKLDHANVRGVDVGYPITLDVKAHDDTNSGILQIENGTLKLGSTPVSLNGSVNTKPTPAQLDMNMAAQNVSIAEVVRLASSFGVGLAPGTTAAGQLTANIHAQGAVDRPALNGNITGTNLQLTSGQMREPVKIPSLQVAMTPTTIHTNQFTPSAGDASVNMQLTLNNYTSDAPNVQFDISGNKLNLNYLQALLSAPPEQQHQKKAESWSLIPRANATVAPAANDSILSRATGNGNINVGTLTYDNLVLTNVQSKVTINRGVITASPLTANLYTGTETGTVVFDTRTNPSTVVINTKFQHVDANGLLSSVSSAKNMLYGLLASNANAKFQAASAEDITRTLNGTLSINLTNGKFTKLDIMNQLASVGKFLNMNQTANKGYTDITSLSGNFNVVNGVAQTNDLKAVLSGATLASQGTINMVNNTVNMKANAVLSKDMSGSVGGNGVGGMMQTALANKNGELVIPVLITGSLDSPHVAPDMQAVADMKMKNMLPSLANPSQLTHGGVSGVIGALTGQQQQTGNQKNTNQQQNQPQNQLNNALNSILGGKKPK